MYKCEKCGKSLKNNAGYGQHIRKCIVSIDITNNIITDYVDNLFSYKEISEKYKINRGNIKRILGDNVRSKSESNKISRIKNPENFKHTEESKAKLREARLKWMKENPEKTAWRQANMSYPEKLFKSKVEELELDKKYLIIRERSFFPYFIDFAFENEKVAIEIDGKQHELPERKESDQEKDDLLMKDGWRVYRIEAKQILERLDDVMVEVIKFIGDSKTFEKCGLITYKEYKTSKEYKIVLSKNKRLELEIQREKNGGLTDKQLNDRKVERPPLEILSKEVDELGYVGAGRKYGVSDTAIRKWIKIYKKYGV